MSMTNYFSLLPEELVEDITVRAGELPDEFYIRHPADDSDPLFIGLSEKKAKKTNDWKTAVTVRRAMVQLSRRFRRITTPMLYSSFSTTNIGHFYRFFSTIQENPVLATYLRRLDIELDPSNYTTAVTELTTVCPNLIMFNAVGPIELEYLPTSLRSLSVTLDSMNISYSDIFNALLRLNLLERLVLRIGVDGNYRDDRGREREQCLSASFLPLLRTVAVGGSILDGLVDGIIHPQTTMQSVYIMDPVPKSLSHSLSSKIRNVTHLSIDFNRIDNIPTNCSIPTLEHLHIQGYPIARSPSFGLVLRLGPISSFSTDIGYYSIFSTTDWLREFTECILSRGSAPDLKRIYTNQSGLERREARDDPLLVLDILERLEGLGIVWLVQSNFVITDVRSLYHTRFGV